MTEDKRLPERVLITRYQACTQRLWAMFPRDPLPPDHPAQGWLERLEALLDHGMLGPVRLTPIMVCPRCLQPTLCNVTKNKAWCTACNAEVKPQVKT